MSTASLVTDTDPARHVADGAAGIAVCLCRDAAMLWRAQRLRYDVYCRELGRWSPHADAAKQIIADELDATGRTFIALDGDEVVGTLRVNLSVDGLLGGLESLYGMPHSEHHPHATAICTKFIVTRAHRGGPTAPGLIAAAVRLGRRHGIRESYIDCIPPLLPYYRALGFRETGASFLHCENGPSLAMVLDVARDGDRLCREVRSTRSRPDASHASIRSQGRPGERS